MSNFKFCAQFRGDRASSCQGVKSNVAISSEKDLTWGPGKQEGNSQILWLQQKKDEISELQKGLQGSCRCIQLGRQKVKSGMAA